MNAIKVAVTGSRLYENKTKIKNTIFNLKNKFGDSLEVVSGGGNHGADKYVRKYALELGVNYTEFNLAHTVKNLYSAMPDSYYGKEYHPSQFFHRNGLITKYVDYMMVFNPKNNKDVTDIKDIIKQAKKKNIKIIIID